MAKSFSISALDMEKFREAMKSAAPAANAVGISVEKTTALLGTLANAGIAGSKAGNNLKTSFINLNAAGLTLEEGLEKVANSSDKLDTATKLVGKNAAASFLVLAEGRETTDRLTEGLLNSAGAAQRMAEIQLDNLIGDVTILGSAWEGFILSVESGEGAFNNFLRQSVQLATKILGVLSGTSDLSTEFFKMQKAVNKLESEVSPLLDRFDELEEQTERTVEEQKEMDDIILKVAEDLPLAITQFDEYGKAMSISTDAARGLIEEQKRLLILQNAPAIQEQVDAIESLSQELKGQKLVVELLNGEWVRYNFVVNRGNVLVKTAVKLTGEELTAIKLRRQAILEDIDTRTQRLAQLKGEKTAGEIALDAAEQGNEVIEDTIEEITDLIKLKQEEIKVANEKAAVDKKALAARNQEVEGLEEELKALRELGIEKKKQAKEEEEAGIDAAVIQAIDEELKAGEIAQAKREKNIEEEFRLRNQVLEDRKDFDVNIAAKSAAERELIEAKFVNDFAALEQERVDAVERANDDIIEDDTETNEERKEQALKLINTIASASLAEIERINQRRNEVLQNEVTDAEESVRIQQEIAREGGENILAEERARLAKAQLEQERERIKQAKIDRAIALAQAFVNSFAAHSKDDPDGALAKALAETFLAQGIAKLISGFAEGGYTGDGGKYDVAGVVHKGENVNTADQVSKYNMRGWSAGDFDKKVSEGHFNAKLPKCF